MKPLLLLAGFLLCITMTAQADTTPFSTNIDTMWVAGNKSGALAIANTRLTANANDIAGLLITLEYQMDYSDITHLKATMDKIIAVGATITTTNFVKLYPDLKDDLTNEETNVLPNVTPTMADSEASKGNTTGQHLTYLTQLKAAELDGLIH
jgi:uncharacterized protein YccT (UPF0319 family)